MLKSSTEEMIDEVFSRNDLVNDEEIDDKSQCCIIVVGNIGCGKSSLVKKFVNKLNCVVINKDSLLESISGGYGRYDSKKKDFYNEAEYSIMRSALRGGYSVVVDRLNINKEQRAKFINIAKEFTNNIIAYDFGSGTEEGLERRKKNSRGVPERMWEEVYKKTKDSYETPTKTEGFSKVLKPPSKYVFHAFDFDNTIYKTKDLVIGEPIQSTIDKIKILYKDMNNIIIIWSCRNDNILNEGVTRLINDKIPFDYINENPLCGFDCSNKVFAHYYYDDRNQEI